METVMVKDDLRVQVTNKQVLSIALPITLSILIPQINMLTNSIFLGQLSTAALGNAGITGVFYLIFAVAGHGLNNGMQSVFSRHAGGNDPDAFKTILSQGIRISLLFAAVVILFTWCIAPAIFKQVSTVDSYTQQISFLRIRIMGIPFLYLFQIANAFLVATLNSRYLMIGFVFEAMVNILLDYVLIKGRFGFPVLGFNGAAIASVIAEATGLIVVMIVLLRSGLKKKYGLLQDFSYNKAISKKIINISTPLMLQYIISVTTWLVFFLLIESRGNEVDKAISNVMRNVFGLAGVFVWAFAATSNVMVSNLMGQSKEDKVLAAINKIMLWSIALCTAMILLLNFFPAAFFSLFGQDEHFVQSGIPVARTVSIGMLFMSIANIWLNGVTGTGKTTINLVIEIIAVIFYLGYTWIFMKIHFISLAMAWSNELVYWSAIFIMAYIYLKSGKWKTKT
jgi:multidrug resistance protein, MATE family